jgi:hypothetical protein
MVTDRDGKVWSYFVDGKTITRCRFDTASNAFVEAGKIELKELPAGAGSISATLLDDSRVQISASVQQGGKAPEGDRTSDDFSVFDGAGVYRGIWPYNGVYVATLTADLSKIVIPPHLWSGDKREIRGGATVLNLPAVGSIVGGVIASSSYGNFYFFPSAGKPGPLGEKRLIKDAAGNVLRHPTTGAIQIPYPNKTVPGATDLIVGGEGCLYYYRATGKADASGTPIYDQPTPVWQQNALVYAGSLAVVSVVDWDGDSNSDLIVGNSEGRILFFKNFGTDASPSFGLGKPLEVFGHEIHLQQGYWSVQNISEARWGYACPTVFDWNGDGLPDLLVGSALQQHFVYLNIGTKTQPKLDLPFPLHSEGNDLHGQWRTRPGVAKMGDRIAYVMQDDAGALARFWRVDDHNVEPDGPMKLTTGKPITLNINGEGAGQKSRPTIELADWDGDGTLDIFIGTAKRGAIPEPEFGLPWYRRKGSGPSTLNLQLVYMHNAGTDVAPKYEYPQQLTFRGQDFYLGAHVNTPAVCRFGNPDGKLSNLLIGIESGHIYFYDHKDIGFAPRPKEVASKPAAKKPVEAGNDQ